MSLLDHLQPHLTFYYRTSLVTLFNHFLSQMFKGFFWKNFAQSVNNPLPKMRMVPDFQFLCTAVGFIFETRNCL